MIGHDKGPFIHGSRELEKWIAKYTFEFKEPIEHTERLEVKMW